MPHTEVDWWDRAAHVGPLILAAMGAIFGWLVWAAKNMFATRQFVHEKIKELDNENTTQHSRIEGKVEKIDQKMDRLVMHLLDGEK